MNPLQFMRMFQGQPIDPLHNLTEACGVYLQHRTIHGWSEPNENEEVIVEMEPEDVKRFEEINELAKHLTRLANSLIHKSRRFSANQTLFWEDIFDRYEDIKLQNIEMVGVRRLSDGRNVLVHTPGDKDGSEEQG